jgi:SOS regulatory protein LexA
MQTLTPKEKIVLAAVERHFAEKGKMPTVREIMARANRAGLGVKSTRSIFVYLKSLEEKGYVARGTGARGIKLMDRFRNMFVDVPIFGAANAGAPRMIAEKYVEGYLKVSKTIVKNRKVFAIQISGNSMNLCEVNRKRIQDGDFVIVDPEDRHFYDGDKVLVVIDGLATVKRFKKVEKGMIGLFPASTEERHKPIYLTTKDEFFVNGKVIDVLKAER